MSILRTVARSFARRVLQAVTDHKTATERNRARPILMILEDRTAPAILTVNSLADVVTASSSALTLREAVTLIDSGGSATDSSGHSLAAAKAGQINTASPFGVNDLIQFAPSLTSSGPQQIVLLEGSLQLDHNATLNGPSAGQLAISGNQQSTVLTIAPGATVGISGLTIEGGAAPGAAGGGVVNDGNLTLVDTLITGNTAAGGNGGGLANYGTLTLVNTTVSENQATNNGGIQNSGGTVTLTNSSVSGNTAVVGNGGIANYGGVLMLINSSVSGNVAAAAGGIGNYLNGTTTLLDSSVTGNSALTNLGGGIFNTATLTLTDSNISGNTALAGNGGGLNNLGTATLINSTVSGNAASNDGGLDNGSGAVLMLSQSTVSGNLAILGNGGLANYGGSVTLLNSTVSGNSALVAGGIGNYSYGTLTLLNSAVSNNYASVRPGGIYNTATLSMTDSTIANNTSLHGDGGGLTNTGTATLLNSTLSGNTATNDGGLYNSGAMLLSNSIVSGNSAVLGNGGLANYGGDLTLLNSTVSGNSALVAGGIGNYEYGTMSVLYSSVSGNYASGRPGGILNTATLTVTDSTIADNTSLHGDGGGLNNVGTATLVNSTVSGNTASDDGGIENTGSLTLIGSTVAANIAVVGNGDLGNDGGSLNVDSNSIIGSALVVSASTTPVVNSAVPGNSATSLTTEDSSNAPTLPVVDSNSSANSATPVESVNVASTDPSTPSAAAVSSNLVDTDVQAALLAATQNIAPARVSAPVDLTAASAILLANEPNGNAGTLPLNDAAIVSGSAASVVDNGVAAAGSTPVDNGLSTTQGGDHAVVVDSNFQTSDGTATTDGQVVADNHAAGMKPTSSQETPALMNRASGASESATMEVFASANAFEFGAQSVALLNQEGDQDTAFQAEWTPGYYLAGLLLLPGFSGLAGPIEEERRKIRA